MPLTHMLGNAGILTVTMIRMRVRQLQLQLLFNNSLLNSKVVDSANIKVPEVGLQH